MPRQDVPYSGAICRLKERIAEIWNKLDQKLHSINGVEGDGAGDVKIVSGDAAVVIDNDQVGHRIEVSLDSSKLPAAAVSSVNGQTGAVRLDAADIPSDGNSNVQLDINWSKTAINDCFDSITTEQGTRQAADDELQININSVQASIPGAAATAVANDPTVAQLAADVPGKLDKISSGSTLKAYTHTGGTQGETDAVNGTDANSIGLRDANGRMQAADPAAGATDKTLVTANWVSQTGDGAPNNLLHRTGNEKVLGMKHGLWFGVLFDTPPVAATPRKWLRYMAFNTRYGISITEIIGTKANNGFCYARAITSGAGEYLRIFPIDNIAGISNIKVALAINKSTNKMEIWIFTAADILSINGLRFYNRSYDTANNQNAEYFNTEYDELPNEGYTPFVYILGSA